MKKVYVIGAALMSLASLKAGIVDIDVKIDVKTNVASSSCVKGLSWPKPKNTDI